jgi:hypothetical protein
MGHKHQSTGDEGAERTVGFAACVADPRARHLCNPKAHGGVTHLETCICGATRRTNSTGEGRTEVGPWIAPAVEAR